VYSQRGTKAHAFLQCCCSACSCEVVWRTFGAAQHQQQASEHHPKAVGTTCSNNAYNFHASHNQHSAANYYHIANDNHSTDYNNHASPNNHDRHHHCSPIGCYIFINIDDYDIDNYADAAPYTSATTPELCSSSRGCNRTVARLGG